MFFKRKEPAKKIECVADLDRIISRSVAFNLHGKQHIIKPISSEKFFEFTHGMWKLDDLANDKDATGKDIKEQYYKVVTSVCDSITMQDIESMTEAQFAGLFKLITDAITGHKFSEEQEKKN